VTREALHVFLGDLHAGSTVAPSVTHEGVDKTIVGPSLVQTALCDFWWQALADVKLAAKGCDLRLHLGGDLVDGVRHHGSTQTSATRTIERRVAVALLEPWVDVAGRVYGLLGTDAHVGDNGEEDATVLSQLGVPPEDRRGYFRIRCSGKVLDWAHHVTGSRREWLKENAGVALANRIRIEYLTRKQPEPPPDLIVRHHIHLDYLTLAHGTYVAAIPGWQAQTSYTRALDPAALLTVGLGLWWPSRNEFRHLLYEFPPEPIEEDRLAPKKRKRKAPAVAV
jgi:hypothetical protein